MGTKTEYRPRVLLVDDDQLLLTLFQGYLSSHGYEVVSCSNAQAALEKFQQDVQYFDLLLTDYQMPGMNGAELCTQIMLLRQDLPLIVVSGDMDDGKLKILRRLGVASVLAKPIKLHTLVDELTQVLGPSLNQ